jgi:diguanylate cyclase (GGDEF)-like protein/PAS domain S-box-containing protein
MDQHKQTKAEAFAFSQKIISASPLGILVYRAAGPCLEANAAATRILKASLNQLLAQNYRNIASWQSCGLLEMVLDALEKGEPSQGEIHMVTSFGREVWLNMNITLFTSRHETHILLVFEDITERRLAEFSLEESEKRYRLLAERAEDLIFRVRFLPDRKLEYVSPSVMQLTGYTPQEHYDNPDLIFSLIHPEDRGLFFGYIHHEEPIRSGEPITLRWVRKDGNVIWLEHKNVPIIDQNGKIVAMESIGRDVTERKRAEKQLAFQASLLVNVNDAVIATDDHFMLTAWNHAAELIYGWTAAEAVGRSADEILRTDYFQEAPVEVAGELRRVGTFSGEIIHYRKDGLPIFIDNKTIALTDERGACVGYVSVNRDITLRKQEEVEIHQNNLYIQLLQEVAVAANEASDLRQALAFVLDRVCEYTGWPLAHVYLPAKQDDQTLLPTGIWHIDREDEYLSFKQITEATTYRSGEGLPGKSYASGRAVWEIDTNPDAAPARTQNQTEIQVRTGLAFPILVGKRAVGVLEFFTQAVVPPDEALQKVMFQIGTLVGRVIERTDLQQALENREQRFRALIEHNKDVIALMDASGKITYESPSIEKVLGYPVEGAVGQDIFDLLHPDDIAIAMDLFAQVLKTPGASLGQHFRARHQDGSWRWLDAVVTNLLEEPAVRAVVLNYADITDRKQREDMLNFMSTHDTMTGLYNRAYLNDQLEQLQRQESAPIIVVAGDIDNLKRINDWYGHDAGDRLIQRTAQILKSVFRKQDIIARMGGDEFIILLPNASPEQAGEIERRILQAVEADNRSQPLEKLGLSVGVAVSERSDLLRAAFHRADQAMYQMKSIHHQSV